MAARFGAQHCGIALTETDFWLLRPQGAAALDGPAAAYATLPAFKMAQAAAREQQMGLSAEGGDELFAGKSPAASREETPASR